MAKEKRRGLLDIIRQIFGMSNNDDSESGYTEDDNGSSYKRPGTGDDLYRDSSGKKESTARDEISDEELFQQAGRLYLGKGCEPDISKATELFERSSEMGNAKASYILYKLHYKDVDEKKTSLKNLTNAANKKYYPAMYDLSIHLLYGDDIEKDVETAERMLSECAEHGHVGAISKLYYLFGTGFEVKQDKVKAEMYRSMLRTVKNG